jgi:hypothetical protein
VLLPPLRAFPVLLLVMTRAMMMELLLLLPLLNAFLMVPGILVFETDYR